MKQRKKDNKRKVLRKKKPRPKQIQRRRMIRRPKRK